MTHPIAGEDGAMSLYQNLQKLAHDVPATRKHLIPLLRSANYREAGIGTGRNGYIGYYRNKQVEVYADTQLQARELAAEHFKARRPTDVSVVLAEKGGQQVTHKPLFAADIKSASWKPPKVNKTLARAVKKVVGTHWHPNSLRAVRDAIGKTVATDLSMSDRIDYQADIKEWKATIKDDDLRNMVRWVATSARSGPAEDYLKGLKAAAALGKRGLTVLQKLHKLDAKHSKPQFYSTKKLPQKTVINLWKDGYLEPQMNVSNGVPNSVRLTAKGTQAVTTDKSAAHYDEQEATEILEDLAGGTRGAFQLMNLWTRANQAGSERDRRNGIVKPVEIFIRAAKRDGFSAKAIAHYVEEIQGSSLPRGWNRQGLKAAAAPENILTPGRPSDHPEVKRFLAQMEAAFKRHFPQGFYYARAQEKFGDNGIYIATATLPKGKQPGGYLQNDPSYNTFWMHTSYGPEGMNERIKIEISEGGSLWGPNHSGRQKIGWRNGTGKPAGAVKKFDRYFAKLKQMVNAQG